MWRILKRRESYIYFRVIYHFYKVHFRKNQRKFCILCKLVKVSVRDWLVYLGWHIGSRKSYRVHFSHATELLPCYYDLFVLISNVALKAESQSKFSARFFFFFFFSTLSVHCHFRQTGGVDGNCFQNIYLLTLEPPRSDC